ncbi:hypothetical protein CROQUDRAFT_88854 [Cronartium quercuum f. sp. fusiforme G11]|uniref:CSD domain-containing protein n=1 Tax=Cronartium quercuum f. sp. fusiforme G11 TaxID=708437 RepID=A0A9P6NMB9_9BASI|nr:hypothetical protein CROQUDRAFT_88854 [Cronartium quercuum f. sp. fusiforme G11]
MSDSTLQSLDSQPALVPIETGTVLSVSENETFPTSLDELPSTDRRAFEHHNRLDSIHLSSDASGETSVVVNASDFSNHSFINSGEGLDEVRNARNPPWSHGVTGTPILHFGPGQYGESTTFAHADSDAVKDSSLQPASEDASATGHEQVLTPRPSAMTASTQAIPTAFRRTDFEAPALELESSQLSHSRTSPLYVSAAPVSSSSPFDSHQTKKPPASMGKYVTHTNSPIKLQKPLSKRSATDLIPESPFHTRASDSVHSENPSHKITHWREAATFQTPIQLLTTQIANTRIVSTGSGSGEGSSEEEESWPMPETPFMPGDSYPLTTAVTKVNLPAPSTSRSDSESSMKKVVARSSPNLQTELVHPKLSPSAVTTLHSKIHHVIGGGRAPPRGLVSHSGAKEGQRRVGRCKMYNCDKGVGFLIDDDLTEVPYDVKIHWTDLYSDQEFKSLAKGEVVEYTLNLTANGYSASYVTGPGGRPVMGAEYTIVQASRQTSYKLFKAGALPVKTYRSKWDGVPSPAGFLDSPELSLRPDQARKDFGSPMTPGITPTSARPPTTHAKTIKLRIPGMSDVQVMNSTQPTMTKLPAKIATPTMVQPSPGLTHPVQHVNSTPWNNYASPQNFSVKPQLSPQPLLRATQAMTPNPALTQYEALLRGYPGPQMVSPSPYFAPNAMQNPAVTPYSMNALLAERHLLLQHQAALVSFYQTNAAQNVAAPHQHVSALLPPISLPTSHAAPVARARTEASSWRPSPTLRPNAQAFSPAFEPSVNDVMADSQYENTLADAHVYQPPGRRTVSDPKPSVLPRKRSLVSNKLAAVEPSTAARGYKRVTFAEDPVRSRRVVSYGAADDDEERVAQRVSSVEIAMERLREAAAPRRLSVISHTNPNLLNGDSMWLGVKGRAHPTPVSI